MRTKSADFKFDTLEAGDSRADEIIIENSSQFRYVVDKMEIVGTKNVKIVNPPSVIGGNSSYSVKLQIDIPLDIQTPLKGQFIMEGRHILE